MEMANSMIGTTENIIASYNLRVKSLGDLMVDTHRTLTGFGADRKRMARKQAETLANFEKELSKTVEGMLDEFHENHRQMGEDQKKHLTNFIKGLMNDASSMLNRFQKDRSKMSKELKTRLTKEVNEIETYIEKRLKEFDEAHIEMTEQQKKDLVRFVGEVRKEVKKQLGDCRKEMADYQKDVDQASHAWRGMAATLAKARKGGLEVEARKQSATSERTAQEKNGDKKRKGPKERREETIS